MLSFAAETIPPQPWKRASSWAALAEHGPATQAWALIYSLAADGAAGRESAELGQNEEQSGKSGPGGLCRGGFRSHNHPTLAASTSQERAMPAAAEGAASSSAPQLLQGTGAWMGNPSVCTNPSDYPSFPRLILAILPRFQLAEEREAERATG